MKKTLGFGVGGALVMVSMHGCSSSSGDTASTDDASVADGRESDASAGDVHAEDAARTPDATPSTDASDDAPLACAPQDVSTFMPPPYVHAKQQIGACTTQQIADFYAKCFAPTAMMSDCMAFQAAAPACSACLAVPSTAATWGATYNTRGTVVSINVPGCMEILGGADGLMCAELYEAAQACEDAACGAACPVSDNTSFQRYQACVQQAAQRGCSMWQAQADACAMAIANGDAGAQVCFFGQTFEQLFLNIAPIFCGPGVTDAGDGGASDAGDGGPSDASDGG